MALPYSARLFALPGFTAGPTLVYTAPADKVAVLKCVSIVWGDATGTGLDAWVQDDGECKVVRKTIFVTLPIQLEAHGGCEIYWGSWVFAPATELYAQTVAGTCDIYGSGYELTAG